MGKYLCTNCECQFGTWSCPEANVYKTDKGVLDIKENVECPICLKINKGISQANCDHTVCIKCFRRCYYCDDSIEQPRFPYSEKIYCEYENCLDNKKWKNEYPLIAIWDKEDECHETQKLQYENEEHLRKCPICRK